MSEDGGIKPAETWALVVAVESYPLRSGLDLDGPFPDACDFIRWLCTRGIALSRMTLLASPLETNKLLCKDLTEEGLECRIGVPVTHDAVEDALKRFRNKPGMLVVFWSGHGIMSTGGVRRPLLGNYSDADKHNLNIDSLLEHLRSTAPFDYPPEQILVFDVCGTRFDELWHRQALPDKKFPTRSEARGRRQYVMFACEDGQTADNLTQQRTGLYYSEFRSVLETQQGWPPDPDTVHEQLKTRFAELRDRGSAVQTPIRYFWQAPSGREEFDLLTREPAGTDAFLEAACVLLRRQMAAIDRECRDRTGKPLEQQSVPVRVARGLRPRLRLEDYEQLERAARQGDYSGRDKQLRDRNEMLRDEETQGRLERPRPVVPWEQVRERLRRGAIVGDPGFGKTMLLWHEVRRRCAGQLEQASLGNVSPEAVELPVFMRASELQPMMRKHGGQPLGEALLRALAARTNLPKSMLPLLRDRLLAGGLFLAVDALEEVPTDERDEVLAALNEYAMEHPAAPLLVSSRLVNYTGCPFPVAEEDEVELLAFDLEQTDAAVRQWFGDDCARAGEMLHHLKPQPVMRAILRSPLLLRLACQSATRSLAAGQPLRLWQRPAELFDDLIDNATSLWEEKTPEKPTMMQQSMFSAFASQVAWELWHNDPAQTLFSLRDLGRAVGQARNQYEDLAVRKDLIRDLCDAGLIVPVSSEKNKTPYLFTHRTIQEYRAALALAAQPDAVRTALAHIYDLSWQPVLQYLGATLKGPYVWEYVRALLLRNAEDLLCRPFRLAVLAAMSADPKELPSYLPDELTGRVVDCFLRRPKWMAEQAIDAMLRACGRRAVPALRSAQHVDQKWDVRCFAVEGLERLLAADEVDPDLRRAIQMEDWAWEAMGGYGPAPTAEDVDAYRASGALTALIKDLVEDDDRDYRYWAVLYLKGLRAPEAVPALLHALRTDEDASIRRSSAEALGVIQAREAVPTLLEALFDEGEHQEVRHQCAFALGALQAREALPSLVQALYFAHKAAPEFNDWTVRNKAAIALRELQDPSAVQPLIVALERDGHQDVRRAAAAALGDLHDAAAMPALRAALYFDDSDRVRREAASSLARLENVLTEAVHIELSHSESGSDLRLMPSLSDMSVMSILGGTSDVERDLKRWNTDLQRVINS